MRITPPSFDLIDRIEVENQPYRQDDMPMAQSYIIYLDNGIEVNELYEKYSCYGKYTLEDQVARWIHQYNPIEFDDPKYFSKTPYGGLQVAKCEYDIVAKKYYWCVYSYDEKYRQHLETEHREYTSGPYAGMCKADKDYEKSYYPRK